MGTSHSKARLGLLATAVTFVIAGCGGQTLEEQATSALERQEDQQSKVKGQAPESGRRPDAQGRPAAGGPAPSSGGGAPSKSKAPTLRIGAAEVHVDRREVRKKAKK